MMNHAKGPVWHKKQREQGIIPKGLRGIDKQATWAQCNAHGWVYGHGIFTLTSHKLPVLGCFVWMKNSANEAKRMWLETFHYKGLLDYVAMDSRSDDYDLFRELKRERKMTLITVCHKNMDKSENREKMLQVMQQPVRKGIYKERILSSRYKAWLCRSSM